MDEAGNNPRKLLNLRNRIARIRVFDPACGSGNFLVIAYKQMREIENTINELRGESGRKSDIPLTNFRGIELRDFSAEIARLALIIAEYQCDVIYLGQKEALQELLPLSAENWITCGNALRMDWLNICPSEGSNIKQYSDDLFEMSPKQSSISFENEGGETFICGNPPYIGDKKQNKQQKSDVKHVFGSLTSSWKSLDYICGFFYKASEYLSSTNSQCAFVSTNSLVQGQHVPRFWSMLIGKIEIFFAENSFKWSNLAANKAGVTCVILGICVPGARKPKKIYHENQVRNVDNISPYLTPGPSVIVKPSSFSISSLPKMTLGNVPKDDGGLLLNQSELNILRTDKRFSTSWIRKALGSSEFIQGKTRYCLWLTNKSLENALKIDAIAERIQNVKKFRDQSVDPGMKSMAQRPHQFREMNCPENIAIVIPRVSSENREFLPMGIFGKDSVVTDRNYAIYDEELWSAAFIASRIHWVWIATVCVRMRTDFSYSNTLGWNTFPVPTLTEKNKEDLTRCAEDILLAREAHFPATIADLYDPEKMPTNLREAHERNDEVLERIYIGRRFKNDTERLEKLFELYTKMAGDAKKPIITKKTSVQ